MPELPDVEVYREALETRVLGQALERVRLPDPFVLRTAVPPVDALVGRRVTAVRRLGKRLAFGFEDERWLVLHLMIAGRLQWVDAPAAPTARNALVHFAFASGTLTLTEAGTKHRASLHVVEGAAGLQAHDPGGIDPLTCTAEEFAAALVRENHTLKRALTDPHLFSGIGNAYSDEILHAAKLSPMKLSRSLSDAEMLRLYDATRATLRVWIDHLRRDAKDGFPEKVTAFRDEMAVHGRYKQPCPVCGKPVQRIVYAENECNYCATCQTNGRLLADRSLSRLLKDDWPKSIDDL